MGLTKIIRGSYAGQIRRLGRSVILIHQSDTIKTNPMKNFIEVTTNSINPIFTAEGWLFVMFPVPVMECFNFYLDPTDEDGGEYLHSTVYLN